MPMQYRAIWSVPGGGIGYSVFHNQRFPDLGSNGQDLADDIRAFFVALAPRLPDDVQIDFDSEVLDLLDDGSLTNVIPVSAGAQVDGTSTAAYQRAGGARVDWLTGQIVGGRRLTGRTYIVPIQGTDFDTEGQLIAANQAAITAAADALVTARNSAGFPLGVWSRTHAVTADVIDVRVPTQGSILRSRRD